MVRMWDGERGEGLEKKHEERENEKEVRMRAGESKRKEIQKWSIKYK